MGEITLKGWECERCDHQWVPREEERPRVCPKCKSPYWDKPRRDEKASYNTARKHARKKT